MIVKKSSNLLIRHSARLTEEKEKDEQNAWAAIFRIPTSNVILVKLKVAIDVDAPVQHIQMV